MLSVVLPMMPVVLDLVSVAAQLRRMRAELDRIGLETAPRLEEAVTAWGRAADLGPALRDRVARARTSWLVAEPLEPLRAYEVEPVRDYRVLATDGSQVFRDRHELPEAFLVNIGLVDIDYSAATVDPGYRPRLRSFPSLAWLPADLYPVVGGQRAEADVRVVGARRFAAECDVLREAIVEAQGCTPVLALLDGTLLLWWLEPEPDRLRGLAPDDVKARTFAALEELVEAARPAGAGPVGYLSAPRSADVVSMLKVVECTEDPVDCDRCPYAAGAKIWTPLRPGGGFLPEPARPCEEVDTLADAALFEWMLVPGQRSPRFRSAAKVTQAYEAPVDFVYLHTGAEIARLEFPAWTTPEGLNRLAGMVADQCAKGLGYPVACAEAHEQAVVRAADRRAFLDLVARGRGGVSVASVKLARKRTSVL